MYFDERMKPLMKYTFFFAPRVEINVIFRIKKLTSFLLYINNFKGLHNSCTYDVIFMMMLHL